jgi:hypothetical protein
MRAEAPRSVSTDCALPADLLFRSLSQSSRPELWQHFSQIVDICRAAFHC